MQWVMAYSVVKVCRHASANNMGHWRISQMRISFTVGNIPPKRYGSGGDLSMWGQESEVPKIIALRKDALVAMQKEGLTKGFPSYVKLEFALFVPTRQLKSIGDLDNFINGVCNSLQAADRNALPHIHKDFLKPEHKDIHPSKSLIIEDDKHILYINAKKVDKDEEKLVQEIYYTIAVEAI
jgi:hypothetical protein